LNLVDLNNYFTLNIQISTIDEYWNWLENSFVENSRAQEWYNGDAPRNLSGFINDKSNRLVGWIIMRQLRIKSNLCESQKMRIDCYDDYNLFNEEKQSFQPGWIINQTNGIYSSAIEQAFIYQTSDELDTYIYVGNHQTYGSDGYVYEFRGRLNDLQTNLSELHQLEWIDKQTRAIIIQFSLYNPNPQLFTSITLLTEFLSTGGVESESRFEPISFESKFFI
jgi:polycystin 1L2